jgi:pentatricopeptide repeat protein
MNMLDTPYYRRCLPPNHLSTHRIQVRTYTALLTSLGNAKQYDRAVEMLYKMQLPEWGGIQVGDVFIGGFHSPTQTANSESYSSII